MIKICVNCIGDDYLEELYGDIGACDFCGTKNVICISTEELSELLEPVLGFYSAVEEFMPVEAIKNIETGGRLIWDALREDWELFPEMEYKILEDLFREMFYSEPGSERIPLGSFVKDEIDYYGIRYQASEELEDKWNSFCDEIKSTNRYFPQSTLDLSLMEELLNYLSIEILPETNLYRARISHTEEKIPCGKMGKPPKEASTAGRANPSGIPYLYIASDIETAIAEVRPSVTDKVTVATFEVVSFARIVDLRNPRVDTPFRFNYYYELRNFTMHLGFLRRLGLEISEPINPKEVEIEYIPLQYLCEFIKNNCFDGVAYRSSVANGYNIAIFSDSKLKCVNTDYYEIVDIDYEASLYE